MRKKLLSYICLCCILGLMFYFFIGCKSNETIYPVTQIRFFVDNQFYDAVMVRKDRFVMPLNPQKEGYDFKYWCCDEALTIRFDAERYATDSSRYDIDVYAKFIEINLDTSAGLS